MTFQGAGALARYTNLCFHFPDHVSITLPACSPPRRRQSHSAKEGRKLKRIGFSSWVANTSYNFPTGALLPPFQVSPPASFNGYRRTLLASSSCFNHRVSTRRPPAATALGAQVDGPALAKAPRPAPPCCPCSFPQALPGNP